MHLTNREEKILQGEYGAAMADALRMVVKVGELYGADKLVKISSAQISGVSYKTIGDAGIDYLYSMAKNSRVSVKTTINPAGMDLKNWKKMNVIDDFFRKKQLKITTLYEKMGVTPTYTCTPYLAGNVPKKDSHISWAESSAVIYANSVLGARTNREGGPIALASGIAGYTANYGLHIKENRSPTIIFDVDKNISDYSLLGGYIGSMIKEGIPYLRIKKVDRYSLKNLGASMATWGAVPMYHIEGVTPEYRDYSLAGLKRVTVTGEDLKQFKELYLHEGDTPELIAFGCPHLSYKEIGSLYKKITSRPHRSNSPEVWICTSRYMAKKAQKELNGLSRWGANVLYDTCMVVTPVENRYHTTAVNSMKAAYYMPKKNFSNQKVIYATTRELVERYL